MATVDPSISALVAAASKVDSKVVSVVDQVLERLESQNLAYRMRTPPKKVGVHPATRGGYGVSAVEVHALGSDIVHMGWSPAATANAVCIEDGGSVGRFSSQLAKTSIGLGIVETS